MKEKNESLCGGGSCFQASQEDRAAAIHDIEQLRGALAGDDLQGLIDLVMHRLLTMTECDYIALHSVDGHHLMLHPEEEVKNCPGRCTACSFYKLLIPHVDDASPFVELPDAKGQCIAPIPQDCPANSLEVAIVHCDGKPWGGLALHYLDRRSAISERDRTALKVSADVMTLALERRSAMIRLRAERDRAIDAEKTRSYFFSAVSHDIRTPLNAIIGFSELLLAGDVSPEEAKRNLNLIVSSGKTLLQLVDDALDLSLMELGKMKFSLEPSDVGEIVREISVMYRLRAHNRNQTIVADIPEMPRLVVDPYRFRQVLCNLIGNAVKYAGPCTIRVSATYEDGVLRMSVSDNGRGVPAEKAKLLMQPFVQADIKNRTEGSGLGLAICSRLVEIGGGTISVETAPGSGFTVRFEVPVPAAPGANAQNMGPAASAAPVGHEMPKRVLVVDDSPVNRAVLKALLRKLDVTDVELAVDGAAGLKKLQGGSPFDWVLSDIWMPVMDGIELIRHIRADGRLAHLKVCAVTADVEERTIYREQGFDALLLKPVTMDSLTGIFGDAHTHSHHHGDAASSRV